MHHVTRLDHGLTIATAEMPHMASVSVGVWVSVGGRHEPAGINGVAHFIEHMLFKGTRRRSALQISQAVEGIGGYLNAFTSEEHTCFYSKALRHRLEDLVDVLFDMLVNSRFAPTDIRREREVIREEVTMYLDQPQHHVQELFNEIMWPDHPLGRPLTGTFETLEHIGKTQLLGFLHSNYTASSLVVVAAGAVRHADVVDSVRHRALCIPAAPRSQGTPFTGARTAPAIRLFRKKTEQSQIAIGFRTCSRNDPRRFALRLLNIVLGENMSSRLFQLVREDRGLAYSIYSTPSLWEDVGDIVVSAGLDAAKIEPVLRLITREFGRLSRNTISPSELQRAQDYALGQIDLALENTEHHMMWLGEQLIGSGRLLSIDEARSQVTQVDAEAIRAAARDFFRPERCALAVVSPIRSDAPLRRAFDP